MRVLLSTIGSRGDVEPMVALGRHLRESGHDAVLCAPPGFDEHVRDLPYVRIGHDLREGPRHVPGGTAATAAAHFAALGHAAVSCDVIVGGAAMQIAGRSIAEKLDIPYHYAAYAPVALPSEHHPPPPVGGPPRPAGVGNREMWDIDDRWWDETWLPALNAQRAEIGLTPVTHVRRHILTERPLLAADPVLAPWIPTAEVSPRAVVQTGAWLAEDHRPLAAPVQAFLDAGDPPLLFSFGSMREPRASATVLLATARELGYRAVIHQGWAGLDLPDVPPDCLMLGETNLQALMTRVTAIAHHGGAGTTTQAALAGIPQVIVPHYFDQPYHAARVTSLGIGTGCPPGEVTTSRLTALLQTALTDPVRSRARSLAESVQTDGTELAAREIVRR